MGLGEGGDGAVVVAGDRSLELKILEAEYFHRYTWHPGWGWRCLELGAQDLRRPKVRCPLHEY